MPESKFESGLEVNRSDRDRPLVVIVGGGITGLAAAHRLTELDPRLRVLVLESASRPGGVLRTVHNRGVPDRGERR